MSQLRSGAPLPGGQARTPSGESVPLSDLLRGGPTALWFLRDQACVLARRHLDRMAQTAAGFEARGWRLLAVVDSDPAVLAGEIPGGGWPFPMLCGDEALFSLWGVATARSPETLGGPHVQEAIARAKAAGFVHGTDSGSPLRLPALFLVRDGALLRCRYAAVAEDLPDPADVLADLPNP